MIYASLRPIRQWRNRFTLPFYLIAGAYSGALWLGAVTAFVDPAATARLALAALVAGLAGVIVKFAYWRDIDAGAGASTMASATGLGHLGTVRSFEAPHTDENYLLQEMGFRVARKHAAKLRAYALLAAFALPLALLVGVLAGVAPTVFLLPAAALAQAGMLLERWLFFAEATHTVTLFYGRAA
jgi:DMSO reductase anchor subunit